MHDHRVAGHRRRARTAIEPELAEYVRGNVRRLVVHQLPERASGPIRVIRLPPPRGRLEARGPAALLVQGVPLDKPLTSTKERVVSGLGALSYLDILKLFTQATESSWSRLRSAEQLRAESDAGAFTYATGLRGTAATGGSATVPEIEASAGLSIAECADGGTASIPDGGALTITAHSTSPAYVPVTVVASGALPPRRPSEAQAKKGSPATFVFVVPEDSASLVVAVSSGQEREFCELER